MLAVIHNCFLFHRDMKESELVRKNLKNNSRRHSFYSEALGGHVDSLNLQAKESVQVLHRKAYTILSDSKAEASFERRLVKAVLSVFANRPGNPNLGVTFKK